MHQLIPLSENIIFGEHEAVMMLLRAYPSDFVPRGHLHVACEDGKHEAFELTVIFGEDAVPSPEAARIMRRVPRRRRR